MSLYTDKALRMAQVFTLPQWFPVTTLDVSTLLVLIVTFAVAVRYFKQKRPENLPPLVPGGWPLLNHMPTKFYRLQLDKWVKEHGNVYSIKLLGKEVVVVSGYTAIKEMMENEVFSSRDDLNIIAATGSDQDIFMAPYGEAFKERRKFAASVFRRLGVKMGPGSIQNKIQEEAGSICEMISGYAERPFDISDDLTTAAGNIICALVFGQRFEYGDTRFQHLQKTMKSLGAEISETRSALIQFIRFIPLVNDPRASIRIHSETVQQFVREEIDRHRVNFDPEDPRDFIDYCLLHLSRQKGGGTWLNDENVVLIVLNLFMAGMDTTAVSLSWAILYMILHPDIQEKVQAELDSVLGANKPSLAHRDQLPFTTATIMESQRIRHIGPLLFFRKASASTRLCGYDIPEGTNLVPYMKSVHMDPEVWPNPDVFDPNRFLDKVGKVVTNPPSFVPFSTGRRNCLGEQLAKMELFLLFSTILQRFVLKVPEGAPEPSTEGVGKSLGMAPATFELCAVCRS